MGGTRSVATLNNGLGSGDSLSEPLALSSRRPNRQGDWVNRPYLKD